MKSRLQPGALLLGVLVVGLVFATSYWLAARVRMAGDQPKDELAWLAHEFQLTDAELARVRVVHAGYKPTCEALCARIAGKRRELTVLLGTTTNVNPEVEKRLTELGALRAECQAQMLRHFHEVARSLPEEQGSRYLVEMRRLTLGLQDQMEDRLVHPAHEHP